jgi:hypothetical protein
MTTTTPRWCALLGVLTGTACGVTATDTAWAGKDFQPLRFSYSSVMSEPGALFALYDCFFQRETPPHLMVYLVVCLFPPSLGMTDPWND